MRPNRRWIAPAALTALAAGTTTAAMLQAASAPPDAQRARTAGDATATTGAPAGNTTAAPNPAPAGTAVPAPSPATAGTAAAVPSPAGNTEIAVTTLGTDLKIVLRAYRTGRYDALVDVAAFRHAGGAWRPAWHERVPGPWFYAPLTGPGGVCSLRVTDRPGAAPTVDVSLLVSPSVGCAPVRHFTVR